MAEPLRQHGQLHWLKPQRGVLGRRRAHQLTHGVCHEGRAMVQAVQPRMDLLIRMRRQRRQEQLNGPPGEGQIVVEGMRGAGDRTRVQGGQSLQRS